MKICTKHWEQLREAVDRKGMGHLVAKSGEDAMNRVVKELEDEELVIFDPLMAANNAIWSAGLKAGGVGMLGKDTNGNEFCPLCMCEGAGGLEMVKTWIEGSTDDCLNHCKEKNLLNNN